MAYQMRHGCLIDESLVPAFDASVRRERQMADGVRLALQQIGLCVDRVEQKPEGCFLTVQRDQDDQESYMVLVAKIGDHFNRGS